MFQLRGLGGEQPANVRCGGGTVWDPNRNSCECAGLSTWDAAKQQCVEISPYAAFLLPGAPQFSVMQAPTVNTGAPTSTPGSTAQANTTPGTQVTMMTPVASSPWYKTWWGVGLLGLGAFAGYKALTKPKAAKAA